MLNVLVILFILSGGCLADYYQSSTSYFCTNKDPQHIVDISQLEGIWYVIEKVIHTEERHYVVNVTTCPVIHISEDRTQSTTYSPIYKTYDTTYGSGYPYNTNPNEPRNPYSNEQDYNTYSKQQEEYDRKTTYDYQRRKWSHKGYIRHLYAMKYLRLYWDDVNLSTVYHLRYNVSQPGFWISSGPDSGSTLPDDRKHFAGTIQVIKAVGNHLVLTFCHPSPEKNQLFTVILSREVWLDSRDVHSVHSMLVRKGLATNAVEKSCNKASSVDLNVVLSLLILGCYVFRFLK